MKVKKKTTTLFDERQSMTFSNHTVVWLYTDWDKLESFS